ncbi:Isy1-domain-containing protein [Macrolepiota fuliginosa MF-IS2]|uniref:Isy1-domain-containing protein n=1 Tax=Macrolepiota fuliginosa MF-IS2 TaxID=1400762 RepID=A0A9P5XA04_9AGAR|nr:Isy1-domain-containing protein [Macrolepiota fuliginosa MF-IS2]
MLYRFREAQAAELGLGTRADRRPKMASACKSLRECERWRGEILREISRKVSKIQDSGLTDYEVRDLNDEINKLLREKRHWENQIVALGGANYRRNVAMLDDDGKEVPGTKGYKYFGRAKDLPGVRELFEGRKKEEEEENQVFAYYKKFLNQGPVYYGDLDDNDQNLLHYERQAEAEDWEEAFVNVRETLGLPSDTPAPPIPGQASTQASIAQPQPTSQPKAKRKTTDGESDVEMDGLRDESKRTKTDTGGDSESTVVQAPDATITTTDPTQLHAQTAASFIPFLQAEQLLPPKMPSREEMESIILQLRKKALVEEYFGEEK